MVSFRRSEELLKRELRVSPLAAQTYSKSYRYYSRGMAPSYMDHGEGCYIFDVDGNKYLDFICALGPVTVGYNEPAINEAVINQVHKFASGTLQSELEVELAEKICEIIPCAEMVRFVKNGGDATTAAVRLARAYTGRDMVLMSGYHGMHDWSIGASENYRGVPEVVRNLTITFSYNDLSDLEKKLQKNKVAAVILEPIQSNGPKEGYLEGVKELAHKYGTILIFDEVVSGFHYALGGAQEVFGVTPDLVAFGKGMANGYPISAVAGRRDLLELIEKGVFISTTFGGDSISMAASLATIKILEQPGFYEHIIKIGTMLHDGIQDCINKYDLNDILAVSGMPAHCGVAFEGYGALDYLDIQSIYSQTILQHKILQFAICFLNAHHTEKEARTYLDAMDEALLKIRKAVDKNSVEGILISGKVNPVFKRNIS